MNIFNALLVHPVLGVATAASLALGGGAMAHDVNSHAKADMQFKAEDKAGWSWNDLRHTTSTKAQTPLDMIIGPNNHLLIHGAVVTSVSTDSLEMKSTWGASSMNWTVETEDAKIVNENNDSKSLSTVSVGDSVNVSGTLSTTHAFTIDASILRDTSR